MTYKDFSDIDFIRDEFFIRWVKNPDRESDLFWSNWIANNPDKRKEVDTARKFLERMSLKEEFVLPERKFYEIHENLISFNKRQVILELNKKERTYHSRWLSVAAVVILLMASAIAIIIYSGQDSKENASIYITKETFKGAKYTISLPDGTKVKLNSASSLRFPETFAADKREVYLNGEAFFEVVKDAERPFIVRSDHIETEVLGTTFNIRAYDNEPEVKVALVSGKVKVRSPMVPEEIVLAPSQMAVYSQTGSNFSKQDFDLRKETGWKDGILEFDNEPLSDVFGELELWYGVNIQTDKAISLTDLYKGEFQDESLKNVLTSIGYASGFQFQIRDKNVTIYPTK